MAAERPAEELYDTEADPHEIENLAADPAYREVLERHRAALEQWQRDVGDLGLVSEAMMVAQMWPAGVQPVTDAPKFIVLGHNPRGGDPRADCCTPSRCAFPSAKPASGPSPTASATSEALSP